MELHAKQPAAPGLDSADCCFADSWGASLPTSVTLTGLELLLEIGLACARPSSFNDPALLFGLFRYATVLSANGTWLALDRNIRTLDRHKKGVLSDEFGCGMACMVARQFANVDNFLDLSDAIRLGWVRTNAPRSRQPDYVGVVTGSTQLVVLEAKGSQGDRQYCRNKQVPSGCDQVSRVRPTAPGYTLALRLVTSILLQREDQATRSSVFVGDPEEAAPYDYEFRDDVRQLCARHHFMRAAVLIGDEPLARALASGEPLRQTTPRDAGVLVRRTISREMHVGSELRFSDRNQEAGLFVGIGERVWRVASHAKFEPSDSRELSVHGATEGRRARVVHETAHRTAVMGNDGVIMEVWTA